MNGNVGLIRLIAEVDNGLSNGVISITEALSKCADILDAAADSEELSVCGALDQLMRKHDLEREVASKRRPLA